MFGGAAAAATAPAGPARRRPSGNLAWVAEWEVHPPATVFKVVHYKDLKSALVDAHVRAYVRDLMPRLEQECRRGPVTAGSLFEALMGEEMATINMRLNNNILNADRNAATVPPWKMFALFAGHFWDCRTTHSTKFELDMLRSYIKTNHGSCSPSLPASSENMAPADPALRHHRGADRIRRPGACGS